MLYWKNFQKLWKFRYIGYFTISILRQRRG